MFTNFFHWSLPLANRIQSTPRILSSFSSASTSSKRSLSFSFSDYNLYRYISHLPMHALCSARLILRDFINANTLKVQIINLFTVKFSPSSFYVISLSLSLSLLDLNISLSTSSQIHSTPFSQDERQCFTRTQDNR
jgi:hypothetical protein